MKDLLNLRKMEKLYRTQISMQSGFLLPWDRISFLLDLWVLERGMVACNTHEFNFRHSGRKSGRFRSGQDIDFVDLKNWIETKGAVHFQPTGCFSSVQFSRSVVSDSLRPHESQHARPPCSSPTPRVYSDSCPLS